jgi:hypothetical protein
VICANTARAGDSDGLTAAVNGFVNQQKIEGAELTTYPSYPSDGSSFMGALENYYRYQYPPAGTILFPVRFVREITVSRNIQPQFDPTQASRLQREIYNRGSRGEISGQNDPTNAQTTFHI